MVKKKRDTLGKISSELLQKEPEQTDAIELGAAMRAGKTGSEFEDAIIVCCDDGKKIYDDNFYIVVLQKKERLMPNVIRNFFFHRHSCPTPNYDQIVYLYDKSDERIDLVWVIPSRDTCFYLKDNALMVDPEEKELLQFVLDFEDGTLMRRAQILNNELQEA